MQQFGQNFGPNSSLGLEFPSRFGLVDPFMSLFGGIVRSSCILFLNHTHSSIEPKQARWEADRRGETERETETETETETEKERKKERQRGRRTGTGRGRRRRRGGERERERETERERGEEGKKQRESERGKQRGRDTEIALTRHTHYCFTAAKSIPD